MRLKETQVITLEDFIGKCLRGGAAENTTPMINLRTLRYGQHRIFKDEQTRKRKGEEHGEDENGPGRARQASQCQKICLMIHES